MASENEVESAVELNADALMDCQNVVGVGHCKLEGTAGEAVAVYVTEKLPLERLAENDRIPETIEIRQGDRNISVPVRVISVGGKISLE